ncbi:hypothetical protein [Natrinema caseinilyticum]|uniref:hypothetical protein n=1 Tax=Natrinema caseinilyticum TaxID=2961570 RepID=UPI0020C4E049|nr:hypothetical protein [Natrinema caseinilyticum]
MQLSRLAGLVFALGLLTTGLVGGTTVVDPDGDGVPPLTELRHGTAVLAADTDGDGVDDGDETRYGTDPTANDTDGDGFDDGAEVTAHETDPLEADTDGDGITDVAEVLDHETDPRASDSDADGLSDGDELEQSETDPRRADTDGDGLADGTEVLEYDTDPKASDTDADGLTDGAETKRQDLFPGADPLRTDIYVEVDTMERTAFEQAEADRIVREFETAPLENPNGSTGASLHFVVDETLPWTSATDVGDLNEYRRRNFDRADHGYHYLVIVENVAGDSGLQNIIGKAGLGTLMVESQPERDETGSTVMHELGHSLGLSNADFEGIDSTEYAFWRYRSVMNYNAPADYYGFSGGSLTGFDDWEYIDDHMFTPSTSAVTVDG